MQHYAPASGFEDEHALQHDLITVDSESGMLVFHTNNVAKQQQKGHRVIGSLGSIGSIGSIRVRKRVEIMGQHFFGQLNLKWGV